MLTRPWSAPLAWRIKTSLHEWLVRSVASTTFLTAGGKETKSEKIFKRKRLRGEGMDHGNDYPLRN